MESTPTVARRTMNLDFYTAMIGRVSRVSPELAAYYPPSGDRRENNLLDAVLAAPDTVDRPRTRIVPHAELWATLDEWIGTVEANVITTGDGLISGDSTAQTYLLTVTGRVLVVFLGTSRNGQPTQDVVTVYQSRAQYDEYAAQAKVESAGDQHEARNRPARFETL